MATWPPSAGALKTAVPPIAQWPKFRITNIAKGGVKNWQCWQCSAGDLKNAGPSANRPPLVR